LGRRQTDIDKIKQLSEIGKTSLLDGHRQNILSAFNNNQDKWYTPEMFNQVLGVSKNYAYKICEGFKQTRIVEKRQVGKRCYFRYRTEETFGK